MSPTYYCNCSSLIVRFDVQNPIMMFKILNDMQKDFGMDISPKVTFDNVLKMKEEEENFCFIIGNQYELFWDEDGKGFSIHCGEDADGLSSELDNFFADVFTKFKNYVTVDRV